VTQAEAKMLEAKLKLSMGGAPSGRDTHSVAEVVAGYITDGVTRLSPGSIDFYRKGEVALPAGFAARPIASATPLVLDNAYADMRAAGAREHTTQKVRRRLSASFNRAVRYGWLAASSCMQPKTSSTTSRASGLSSNRSLTRWSASTAVRPTDWSRFRDATGDGDASPNES